MASRGWRLLRVGVTLAFRSARHNSVDSSESGDDLESTADSPYYEAGDDIPFDLENQGANEVTHFLWNQRKCRGTPLHLAVLTKDLQAATNILDREPQLICARFHYETEFEGEVQEGSGEAIHIAATRDKVEIVQLLLARRAQLDSFVTRDSKNHYDVLHSAVFSEGRGGSVQMIRMLLSANAEIRQNLDKRWPLHLAFLTGQVELMRFMTEEMDKRGLLPNVLKDNDGLLSPLKTGIQRRNLSEEQLSQVAPLAPQSLITFIRHQPKCIPSFLRRLEEQNSLSAGELVKLVKVNDICRVIKAAPEAADALLKALLETPSVESRGWHPLPSRVSFAPRTFWQFLQAMLSPPRDCFALYAQDKIWRYNTKSFKEPGWHAQIIDRRLGPPIRSAHIKVCAVPNIVCREFLAALRLATHDENLFIFKNPVIKCMLELVWSQGAVKIDFVLMVLSIWALVLLIVDTARDSLLLEGHNCAHGNSNSETLNCSIGIANSTSVPGTSGDFVMARAMVDFVHEIAQLYGYYLIGRWKDYFDWGNLYDFIRCMLPLLLFIRSENRVFEMFVILLYWMRLLEFHFSETISRELMPILGLARKLIPASVVASIFFCAIVHAYYVLGSLSADKSNHEAIWNTFQSLFTGNCDDDEFCKGTPLRKFVTYGSVILFSVFFLNIFIGVIGENYSNQKRISRLMYQNARANCCCQFLLRASVIPGMLCSPLIASIVAMLAALVSLAAQVIDFALDGGHKLPPWLQRSIFVIAQGIMVIAAYQNPAKLWARPSMNHQRNFDLLGDEDFAIGTSFRNISPGDGDEPDVSQLSDDEEEQQEDADQKDADHYLWCILDDQQEESLQHDKNQ